MMRTKLNMWDLGRSLGKDKWCTFCKIEEETIEHILECPEIEINTECKPGGRWIKSKVDTDLEELTEYIKMVLKKKKKTMNNNER